MIQIAFKTLNNLIFFCSFLIPLVGYGKIFWQGFKFINKYVFIKISLRVRRSVDNKAPGLSEVARLKRKNKNLVTMKFNMINSVLEMVATLIVMIRTDELFAVFYIFFTSCGTPLVYYMGIEENRIKAEEYLKENIETFKKKTKKRTNKIQIGQIILFDHPCVASFNIVLYCYYLFYNPRYSIVL